MTPTAGTRKLTYDDYAALPEDGLRHEIIAGERYVSPSPNRTHQRVIRELGMRLEAFVAQHPCGEVFRAPFDVVFTPHDVVEPDILFISQARESIATEANVQGAPDLVVEVLSPATRGRDEGIKRALYERAGVAEYWIVDPDLRTVRIWQALPQADPPRFGAPIELGPDDKLSTPLLPGPAIPLAEIFP